MLEELINLSYNIVELSKIDIDNDQVRQDINMLGEDLLYNKLVSYLFINGNDFLQPIDLLVTFKETNDTALVARTVLKRCEEKY